MQTDPPWQNKHRQGQGAIPLQGYIAAASRLPGKPGDAGIITYDLLQISYRLSFF
jgi:hypothetical protein